MLRLLWLVVFDDHMGFCRVCTFTLTRQGTVPNLGIDAPPVTAAKAQYDAG